MLWQDQFKYSYPPLPDDDFQSPICENGPVISEDESDIKDLESESKETLESSFSSDQNIKPKKVQYILYISHSHDIHIKHDTIYIKTFSRGHSSKNFENKLLLMYYFVLNTFIKL